MKKWRKRNNERKIINNNIKKYTNNRYKIKTRFKRLGIKFDIINSGILGQIFILSCPNRKLFTQSVNCTAFESPTIKKTKKNFHLSIIFYFFRFYTGFEPSAAMVRTIL